MSTKVTIRAGQHHHLYEECFDDQHVYLQLDHVQFHASSSADFIGPTITVRLPRALAVQLGLLPQSGALGREDDCA